MRHPLDALDGMRHPLDGTLIRGKRRHEPDDEPPTGKSWLNWSEAVRRLPAVENIEDFDIQQDVIRLSAEAPEYFWEVPASTSGHHPEVCQRRHGLWAHTLLVAHAVEELKWTYVERGLVSEEAVDLARAAAILHDQRKNGPPDDPSDSSVSDHDLQMADVVEEESDLFYTVSDCIASHMGPSYDGPEPSATGITDLVHMADMVASRPNWRAEVPWDVPKELRRIGVEGGDDGS